MKIKPPTARRKQHVIEKFKFFNSIKLGCCKAIHPDDFPAYRHALAAYMKETGRVLAVRSDKENVSFWRTK